MTIHQHMGGYHNGTLVTNLSQICLKCHIVINVITLSKISWHTFSFRFITMFRGTMFEKSLCWEKNTFWAQFTKMTSFCFFVNKNFVFSQFPMITYCFVTNVTSHRLMSISDMFISSFRRDKCFATKITFKGAIIFMIPFNV